MSDFIKTAWADGVAPGISAAELQRIEAGIDTAHDELHPPAWTGAALPTEGNFEGRRVFATLLTNVEFRNREYTFRNGAWRLSSPFSIGRWYASNFGPFVGDAQLFEWVLSPTPCPIEVSGEAHVTAESNKTSGTAPQVEPRFHRDIGAGLILHAGGFRTMPIGLGGVWMSCPLHMNPEAHPQRPTLRYVFSVQVYTGGVQIYGNAPHSIRARLNIQ